MDASSFLHDPSSVTLSGSPPMTMAESPLAGCHPGMDPSARQPTLAEVKAERERARAQRREALRRKRMMSMMGGVAATTSMSGGSGSSSSTPIVQSNGVVMQGSWTRTSHTTSPLYKSDGSLGGGAMGMKSSNIVILAPGQSMPPQDSSATNPATTVIDPSKSPTATNTTAAVQPSRVFIQPVFSQHASGSQQVTYTPLPAASATTSPTQFHPSPFSAPSPSPSFSPSARSPSFSPPSSHRINVRHHSTATPATAHTSSTSQRDFPSNEFNPNTPLSPDPDSSSVDVLDRVNESFWKHVRSWDDEKRSNVMRRMAFAQAVAGCVYLFTCASTLSTSELNPPVHWLSVCMGLASICLAYLLHWAAKRLHLTAMLWWLVLGSFQLLCLIILSILSFHVDLTLLDARIRTAVWMGARSAVSSVTAEVAPAPTDQDQEEEPDLNSIIGNVGESDDSSISTNQGLTSSSPIMQLEPHAHMESLRKVGLSNLHLIGGATLVLAVFMLISLCFVMAIRSHIMDEESHHQSTKSRQEQYERRLQQRHRMARVSERSKERRRLRKQRGRIFAASPTSPFSSSGTGSAFGATGGRSPEVSMTALNSVHRSLLSPSPSRSHNHDDETSSLHRTAPYPDQSLHSSRRTTSTSSSDSGTGAAAAAGPSRSSSSAAAGSIEISIHPVSADADGAERLSAALRQLTQQSTQQEQEDGTQEQA